MVFQISSSDHLIQFGMNLVDDCIYHKFEGSKYIFLALCVDDILFSNNDMSLLDDIKRILAENFEMKDLDNLSFVLSIPIHQDHCRGILGLSQKRYIEKGS